MKQSLNNQELNHRELLDYTLAYQSLEHLTVARVVYYLTYIFKNGADEIIVGYDTTTPTNLANSIYFSGYAASCIKIWFWGGPPGEEEWYEGTLLTMLIDRLFYSVVMNHNEIVDKFLETLSGKRLTKVS